MIQEQYHFNRLIIKKYNMPTIQEQLKKIDGELKETARDLHCNIISVNEGTERLRTSAIELVKSVVEEELKRWEEVKLDMDVIICECGEPYKDTDPADKINDSIANLKETLKQL